MKDKDIPQDSGTGTVNGFEENFKKATSEMLALSLLLKNEMYIFEIIQKLDELSNGACSITFPYAIIYRLEKREYIKLVGKRPAEDKRLRQYYGITDQGKAYLFQLLESYKKVQKGIDLILNAVLATSLAQMGGE